MLLKNPCSYKERKLLSFKVHPGKYKITEVTIKE